MEKTVVEATIAGRTVRLETGRLARQASGSVMVTSGETMVLVTAVAENKPREGRDFFPLTVIYQERFYAAGKIPGSYFRREGRLTTEETLYSRIIDRPLRPLFPDGFMNETQIVATVVSYDGDNETPMLGMLGASAALGLSNIPFEGVLGCCRVVQSGGRIVVNPDAETRANATMDILMAASDDAIVMVEGGAKQVPESLVLEALKQGHAVCRQMIALQREFFKKAGVKEKMAFTPPAKDEALIAKLDKELAGPLGEAMRIPVKQERYGKIDELTGAFKEAWKAAKGDAWNDDAKRQLSDAIDELKTRLMRQRLKQEMIRIDGRDTRTVRPIWTEAGTLPRAHGSAVFTRGETQVLAAVALGTGRDEMDIDSIKGRSSKAFYLHYNFPPFSVGETGRMGGPGRREIGHGMLAERAIEAILPPREKFPYTIRMVAETLESNGSSSMGSVCSGCLALMDAGVPVVAPVAGIAMGLVHEGDSFIILSDILGDEDHLGDMDFKVAGTKDGITAIQMDIKIAGLTMDVMEKALEQAREGRLHILGKMAETLSAPRADLSPYAPRLEVIHINPEKIRLVIGPGGEMIRKLIAESGVDGIDIEDDGSVTISSPDGIKLQRAREMISALTEDVELGKVYQGIVKKVVDFGAFVEVFPGTEGLLHISEMDRQRVAQVTDVVNEGDRIEVKCIEIDDTTGKIRLSHKAVLFDQDRANGIEVPEQAERPPRERFDRDRGPRRGPPRR